MSKTKKLASISEKSCVACGSCAAVCPKHAIAIAYGAFAKIDPAACVGCGLCRRECPAGVISILEVPQ